ncbi:HNH endonuclease [Lysobacter sp. Root983]|uniref:HNH endonuclease n=1 Tax=Lysobacter sp. Root983 TaxID=1736613 RepID=UPI000708B7FE|nr:HNH endonuclease [Lysobacter sp. Root983]KRD74471.1 hypothetical protein ASE43_14605 [Lysobacter sp. Root983]
MSRSVYVLRIKPEFTDLVPQALQDDVLFIGWGEVPQLLTPTNTREDFRDALSAQYYPDAKTLNKAGAAAGNLWRFLRELPVGGVVLVPHRKKFYVAQVASEPVHRPDFHGFAGFERAARWLNDKRPFTQDARPEVYQVLLERKTCYFGGQPQVLSFVDSLLIDSSVADDLQALADRKDLNKTTREALVEARVGQGRYRDDLLAAWDNACAVTGCDEPKVLRASHALPWCKASDRERLDINNGLPLLANIDALFDAGLIAFEDDGQMLVSNKVNPKHHALLGVPARLRRAPTDEQAHFLRKHRALKFKG